MCGGNFKAVSDLGQQTFLVIVGQFERFSNSSRTIDATQSVSGVRLLALIHTVALARWFSYTT